MHLYANGEIKIVGSNPPFKGEDGSEVRYFTNYLKLEETDEVVVVNSSKDYSAHEGKFGVFTFNIRDRIGGGYKLSLSDFVLGIPDVQIDT